MHIYYTGFLVFIAPFSEVSCAIVYLFKIQRYIGVHLYFIAVCNRRYIHINLKRRKNMLITIRIPTSRHSLPAKLQTRWEIFF